MVFVISPLVYWPKTSNVGHLKYLLHAVDLWEYSVA